MRISNNRRNPANSGFLDLLQKYWLVLVGLIVGLPFILRYLKDAQTSNAVNDVEENIKLNVAKNLDPIKQQTELDKMGNAGYQKIARRLASNLGTLYSARGGWNPLNWLRSLTENDTEVYNDLKLLKNSGQIGVVSKMYFFLVGRNLKEDVIQYLDTELLKKLPLFN